MIEINMDVEYKLKRIAENLFLNPAERDKLFQIYLNSDPLERDAIVDDVKRRSEIRSIEIRHDLKQRIRNS
jgi:hypothetical protein